MITEKWGNVWYGDQNGIFVFVGTDNPAIWIWNTVLCSPVLHSGQAKCECVCAKQPLKQGQLVFSWSSSLHIGVSSSRFHVSKWVWLLRSSQEGVLGNAVHGGSALLKPLPCVYIYIWGPEFPRAKAMLFLVYVVRLNRLTWTGNFWLMPWNSTFCSKNICMFSITVWPMFY